MTNKLREEYDIEDFLTDESFINYYLQTNTQDELSWSNWIANHPEKKSLVKKAEEMAETLSLRISENEYQDELRKITSAIHAETPKSTFHLLSRNEPQRTTSTKNKLLRFAVPVLIIFSTGVYFFIHALQSSKQFVQTINNRNQPIDITLSDSTLVTLAPESELKYPRHFSNNKRNVYLKGDAKFSVKRNENAPFKVYSDNMIATVLGTVFTFSNSNDSTVIELLSGSLNVELKNNKDKTQIHLAPKDKAVYVGYNRHFYKQSYIRLVNILFSRNEFSEIALKFKDAFGVTLINTSDKKLWRFTGEFKNASVEEVIESICQVKGLTHITKGDTIFIK